MPYRDVKSALPVENSREPRLLAGNVTEKQRHGDAVE